MATITSIIRSGGELLIYAEHNGVVPTDEAGNPAPYIWPAEPPESMKVGGEEWLATCCREACLLAEAHVVAMAPEAPVEVAIPAEFAR